MLLHTDQIKGFNSFIVNNTKIKPRFILLKLSGKPCTGLFGSDDTKNDESDAGYGLVWTRGYDQILIGILTRSRDCLATKTDSRSYFIRVEGE